MTCFPNRFIPFVFHLDMFKDGQPAFPMTRALQGESGITAALDARGIAVVAAYLPVGRTGLGIGVKTDTAELYHSVTHRLHWLMVMIVALVAIGTIVLRIQVQPLAKLLVAANAELQADAARLSRVIAVQDSIASMQFDFNHMLQNIVKQLLELTTATGTVIELIEGEDLYYRAAAGGLAAAIGYRLKIEGSLSGIAVKSRRLEICQDAETDPRVNSIAVSQLNIRSMMLAPLLYESEVIGIIKIVSPKPYGLKDTDAQTLQLLSGIIGAAIGKQQLYDTKQRLLVEQTMIAQHDILTGLPNRLVFLDRLAMAVSRAKRDQITIGLMFLDLDGFKAINDTHGHHVGDIVLKEVAARLQHIVRQTDTVCRLGGDEFTLIFEGFAKPRHDAEEIANKILAIIQRPVMVEGRPLNLTLSIGIALSFAGGQSPQQLINQADAQMYQAKKAGKNAYSLFVNDDIVDT